ncbi:hypothetical protein D9757_002361 [Collybiopsis confluens]|uniref:Uncharacterized protein n=1 Tax=Collybiopsis confluens TaxID=2823264 RepID=A0A8H5HXV8_9AGAR|nr:hypothetical protein D9757_002361 [Collybiopsis confluens]
MLPPLLAVFLLFFHIAFARLERKVSMRNIPTLSSGVDGAPAPSGSNEATIFVVTISAANPAVTGLTNAVTVDINGSITRIEPNPDSGTFGTFSSLSTGSTTGSVRTTDFSRSASATSTTLATPPLPNPPPSGSGVDIQTFAGALGNITAPLVLDLGNGEFEVEGSSSFDNEKNALDRSCDIQHNDCANAANAAHDTSFSVNDCDAQETACKGLPGAVV